MNWIRFSTRSLQGFATALCISATIDRPHIDTEELKEILKTAGNWGSKEALRYVEHFVLRGYGRSIISRLRGSQGSAKTAEEMREGYPFVTRINFKHITPSFLETKCMRSTPTLIH